jgi:serine/threonine protein kinase
MPPIPKLSAVPPKAGVGGVAPLNLNPTRPRRQSSLRDAPANAPELINRMGKGTYGSVWAARQRTPMADGERPLVAVKIMPLPAAVSQHDRDSQAGLEKEIDLMRSFTHHNIVTFFDAFVHEDSEIWVVMERCAFVSAPRSPSPAPDAAPSPRGVAGASWARSTT